MADTDASSIQRRMDEILSLLTRDGFSGGAPAAGNAEWRTALEREYQELARRLPKAGDQADALEINGRISCGFIPRPEVQPDDDGEDAADPFLRFARELGQEWR